MMMIPPKPNSQKRLQSKVKKSTLLLVQTTKDKAKQKEFLILNENPDETKTFVIPVTKIVNEPSRSSLVSNISVKRETPSLNHPLRVKKADVMMMRRTGKQSSEPNGLGLSVNEKNSLLKASVSNPRTLLLAPLLVAAPMMIAEAMTVGGVGLVVPGLVIIPLLAVPFLIIMFIIFI
jgi:hypothetical protein